jgi:hypothetical protein
MDVTATPPRHCSVGVLSVALKPPAVQGPLLSASGKFDQPRTKAQLKDEKTIKFGQ